MTAAELWLPPTARITEHRKAPPPKLGEAFGQWAGQDTQYLTLPGGGVLAFDLEKLTLADYRMMRTNYQINSSLTVLSFMLHQIDWRITCPNQKIATFVEDTLRQIWPRLMRAMSQAHWAGYSPNVLQWDNELTGNRVVLTKIKDLVPEECQVNWKEVEGFAPPGRTPPKFKVYDGIKQRGQPGPIPPENSLWFSLLMENGDYYGRKLLKPAFTPWFFSILLHLFANRYYERFGEPVPIGRADFEQTLVLDGEEVSGRDAMIQILSNLRSRGVVVLPSDRLQVGDSGRSEYQYDISYLEAQMRGADFERYMTRLDEEMSIGLFQPLLLLRTGDVGSYNLGVSHLQIFLWMLNAVTIDMKDYIDTYIVNRLVEFNFGPKAPRAYWVPRKMGKENMETIRAIVAELVRGKLVQADLRELSDIVGVELTEAETPEAPEPEPQPEDESQPDDRLPRDRGERRRTRPRGVNEPRATGREIAARLANQVRNAFTRGEFGSGFRPKLGYRRRFEESLRAEGADPTTAAHLTDDLYRRMDAWLAEVVSLGLEEFSTPEGFMSLFNRMLESEVSLLADESGS